MTTRLEDKLTYDISIKPYQDCCSYFVPIHPETKAKMDEIITISSKLDLQKEYNDAYIEYEVNQRKEYFNNIYDGIKKPTYEQQRAIVIDEKNNFIKFIIATHDEEYFSNHYRKGHWFVDLSTLSNLDKIGTT